MPDKRLTRLRVVPRPPQDLRLALQMFVTAKEVAGVTERTLGNYRQFLEPFITWLTEQGVDDTAAITVNHIRSYLVTIRQRPGKRGAQHLSDDTVHTHGKHIRVWLRWLRANKVIHTDPTENLELPSPTKELQPVFTQADAKKLFKAARTLRDKAILALLFDTGLRVAEVASLRIGDIDPETGDVSVIRGKGKRGRTAFLGDKGRLIMLHYLKERHAQEDEPLFLSTWGESQGEALTVSGLVMFCRRMGERAGVKNCHPHTFRRTFFTAALDEGLDLSAVQRIGGHASLVPTQRYINRTSSKLRAAHRRHSPLDALLK